VGVIRNPLRKSFSEPTVGAPVVLGQRMRVLETDMPMHDSETFSG
jgi:hypothetical protein